MRNKTTLSMKSHVRLFWIYGSLAIALTLAHLYRVRFNPDDYLFLIVIGLGLVASMVGILLNKPERTTIWYVFFCARVAILVGILSSHRIAQNATGYMRVSDADVWYLASYILFIVFTILLCKSGFKSRSWNGMIDGMAVLMGLAIIGWKLVVLPTISNTQLAIPTTPLIRMLYPLACFAVLSGLVWSSTLLLNVTTSFRLLVLGTLCYTVGEISYHIYQMSIGQPPPYVVIFWLLAYVFWGAATLHPSARNALIVSESEVSRSNGCLRLLAVSTLAVPIVAMIQSQSSWSIDLVVTFVASAVMAMLIWVRVQRLVKNIQAKSISLKHQAQTDHLSLLANRRQLEKHFDLKVKSGSLPSPCFALMIIDLDRFRGVNSAFGFPAGDEIVRQVASRLREIAHPSDLVARLGGDEFAVLAALDVRDEAVGRAWRLQECFNAPFPVQNSENLKVAASIGVALHSVELADFSSLLEAADAAMRVAKRRLSRVELYSAELMGTSVSTSQLLSEVSAAILQGQLVPFFQPKVDLASGRVIGAEALVRWLHPVRGMILPFSFIPQIETTELIRDLTNSMLAQSLEQCADWLRGGLRLPVAVNVSTRNLSDSRFVDDVQNLLDTYGLTPEMLEIEITELSAIDEIDRVNLVVRQLREKGVRLSIDDFGTGYGSLAYLQDLPVHCVKLERRFICDLCHSQNSGFIVRHTVELARKLNVDVVAEGVEDAITQDLLVELGCTKMQGYFYSPPIPSIKLRETVRQIETKLSKAHQLVP